MHNTAVPSVSFRLQFGVGGIIHHQKNLHKASQFTEHFLFHSPTWSSHQLWEGLEVGISYLSH